MSPAESARRESELAKAREVLAEAERLDFSNAGAVAWMLGRMEQTVKALVYLIEEDSR